MGCLKRRKEGRRWVVLREKRREGGGRFYEKEDGRKVGGLKRRKEGGRWVVLRERRREEGGWS